MRRVAVVGTSGAGKTTLALDLAAALGVPAVELDAVVHQAGWVPLPMPALRQRVAALAAIDGWVVDGNYSAVRDLVWSRADTIVWVDAPRRLVVRRIVARTLLRMLTGRVLWNGNRESWRNLMSRDPLDNIVLWAWTSHPRRRRAYAIAMAQAGPASPRWVRLRSAAERAAFVAAVRDHSAT